MTDKPARGRPRQYDPEEALAAALGEFRRRGYTATSLDHLSEATGMARPSLYAAFGSKRDIYLRAVGQYVEHWSDLRQQALFGETELQVALDRYFGLLVDVYAEGDGDPLGCPVLSIIPSEAASDPELRKELATAIGRTDERLRERLEIARKAGQIEKGADIDALADMLAAIQHSLALRARAGARGSELTATARALVTLTLQSVGVGSPAA